MANGYNTSNYKEQGGARDVIGGSLDVISGGEIDVETGAAFKVAGTDVTDEVAALSGLTATAAELNLNDISAQTETVTEAGAISVVKKITNLDSTGGTFAATLAAPDASMLGVVKTIQMTVDGGNVTLALTNVQGQSAGTTATFADVGDALVLVGGAVKWAVIGEAGIALA